MDGTRVILVLRGMPRREEDTKPDNFFDMDVRHGDANDQRLNIATISQVIIDIDRILLLGDEFRLISCNQLSSAHERKTIGCGVGPSIPGG